VSTRFLVLYWFDRSETAEDPRLGIAVPKQLGGAVVRNRVRRRLRAALRELLAEGRLPAGTYLLGAGPELATMPWPQLLALVHDTCAEARR